jgi:multidrug efflux system membrane fusion protein
MSKAYTMKSKSSYIMAGIVALAVAGWMFSDDLLKKYGGDAAEEIAKADTRKIDSKPNSAPQQNFTVSAVQVSNQPVIRVVRASGVSKPTFEMTVSAKAAGQIIMINAVEGNEVQAGDILVRLDKGTLPEQIDAAKANLEVAKRRREITERLAKKNFSAPLEQAERAAAYATANASLRQLEEQLFDTVIAAPVSGYLEILHVEKGERVRRDTAIATILGLDKLSVVVAVPQNEVAQIKIGTKVTVEIAGNGSRSGIVSRIAAKSNPATRTFDVEIDLPNKDRKIRAGMSVEATINAGTLLAFAMSPAHLSVGENGELTAKTVVDGKAVLVPVDVVRSGAELVFVSGLPDNAILLTVGQGFVEDGTEVVYKLASTS